MRIDEFELNDEYVPCRRDDNIADVLKEVQQNQDPRKKIKYIIVVENKKPIGIVSFRDIVLRLRDEKKPLKDIKVEQLMTTPVITVKNSRDADQVYNLMVNMGFMSLPVVDDRENFIGCITINDLAEKMTNK